jgi:OPT family oligopeptide transporter
LLAFASGISVVLIIPIGILEAVSNVSVGLNVISELVGGFVVPGKAIAMNMFKAYGCLCLMMAINFSSDLKLGHYSKIPPRAMFRAQILATFVSVLAVPPFDPKADTEQTLVVMNWQLDNIPDICEPDQKDKFACMGTHTFFTSSIIWGTLGPARMYGTKGIYHPTIYGFLIGALLPIPFYILSRWRYPSLRHVFVPTFLVGGLFWAPLNLTWVTPALYFGYLFNVYIRKRYFGWWGTYNVRSHMERKLKP